jgi:hypothetical protein
MLDCLALLGGFLMEPFVLLLLSLARDQERL